MKVRRRVAIFIVFIVCPPQTLRRAKTAPANLDFGANVKCDIELRNPDADLARALPSQYMHTHNATCGNNRSETSCCDQKLGDSRVSHAGCPKRATSGAIETTPSKRLLAVNDDIDTCCAVRCSTPGGAARLRAP